MKARTKTQTILVYLFTLLFLFCMVAGLFSCTPQQRLARLLKNHPELVKKDSSLQNISIPGKKAEVNENAEKQETNLDSAFKSLEGKLSAELLAELKIIASKAIKETPFKAKWQDFNINGIKGNVAINEKGEIKINIETLPYDTQVVVRYVDINPGNGIEKKEWYKELRFFDWLIIAALIAFVIHEFRRK